MNNNLEDIDDLIDNNVIQETLEKLVDQKKNIVRKEKFLIVLKVKFLFQIQVNINGQLNVSSAFLNRDDKFCLTSRPTNLLKTINLNQYFKNIDLDQI